LRVLPALAKRRCSTARSQCTCQWGCDLGAAWRASAPARRRRHSRWPRLPRWRNTTRIGREDDGEEEWWKAAGLCLKQQQQYSSVPPHVGRLDSRSSC
jgi:hypothetical protein